MIRTLTKLMLGIFSFAIASGAITNSALANGFDTFGKQRELIRTFIVDVGEAEKLDLPIGNSLASETIKLSGRCFKYLGYLGPWGLDRKAALLLVDQSKAVKIALLDNGIGSVKVDVISVVETPCQANYPEDLSIESDPALEQLRQRQKALREQYERLQKQR